MFILKHLKTLQPVSIIIQIIFRELVCSSLKSLILKFVKNVKDRPKRTWADGIRGLMEDDWNDRSNWSKKIL